MSKGEGLVSINMTSFFNRELFMYSLGDIKFRKPIALKKMAYILAFFIAWTIPILLIFGLKINVFYLAILIAPPFVLGNLASKPRFGGLTLMAWFKNASEFMTTPKSWSDVGGSQDKDGSCDYNTDSQIWISRRRELQILADLKEGRNKETL